PSQNLHPNNSPDLFKSDTGDDRLPQNPVGGGVGKYDKVELSREVMPMISMGKYPIDVQPLNNQGLLGSICSSLYISNNQ
uniref:hypothetical protein n=1 Tax=Thiolapillus sp. TaxID=2017437 RepID=UPI0025F187D9